MRRRPVSLIGFVLVLIGTLSLVSQPAAAQNRQEPAAATNAGPPGRTADGQPDIRGSWTKQGAGTKEFNVVYAPVTPNNRSGYPVIGIFDDGTVGFKANLRETRGEDVVREGIVDLEPDGGLPWHPWAFEERKAKTKKLMDPESLADLQPGQRCMAPSVNKLGSPKILQSPGKVVMVYNDVYRIIPLDGRPHVGTAMRLFSGNPRGRWEGNTLIVESTNFTGMTWHNMTGLFESDVMRIIERFTVVDADTMEYEITVDDPELFTRTWTTRGSFQRDRRDPKDSDFLEIACHEGNVVGRALESSLWRLGRARPSAR